jgi:aryl-alcohol dehydrogenase-like predicted oxidoreductase
VDDGVSLRALHAAIDTGMNLIDTADVYGDGRSERLIARLKKERPWDTIWIATKAGSLLPRQTAEGYSRSMAAAARQRRPSIEVNKSVKASSRIEHKVVADYSSELRTPGLDRR